MHGGDRLGSSGNPQRTNQQRLNANANANAFWGSTHAHAPSAPVAVPTQAKPIPVPVPLADEFPALGMGAPAGMTRSCD